MSTTNQHTDTRVWLIRFTDINGDRRVVVQRYNALNEYMAQFPDATADEVDVLQLQQALADPWRGLYAPEQMPKLTGMEYAAHHPDLPMWGDDREESIVPLLTAQGFEAKVVTGDYPEDEGDVSAMLADWEPESPGDDWRLVAIYDTEDSDMAALFVRPLAMAVQP